MDKLMSTRWGGSVLAYVRFGSHITPLMPVVRTDTSNVHICEDEMHDILRLSLERDAELLANDT